MPRTDTDRINWIITAEPDIEKTLDDRWRVTAVEEYEHQDLRAALDMAINAEGGL